MTITNSVGLLCNQKVHQNNGRHITLVDKISKNMIFLDTGYITINKYDVTTKRLYIMV